MASVKTILKCAAIALEHLGPQIDIQGGGTDLAYPHHECSAAHAAAVSGRWPFAGSYVHSGMLAFKGTKMSKSLGNLVFVSVLRRDGVDPMAIRTSLLSHHYRADWEWTSDVLDDGIVVYSGTARELAADEARVRALAGASAEEWAVT